MPCAKTSMGNASRPATESTVANLRARVAVCDAARTPVCSCARVTSLMKTSSGRALVSRSRLVLWRRHPGPVGVAAGADVEQMLARGDLQMVLSSGEHADRLLGPARRHVSSTLRPTSRGGHPAVCHAARRAARSNSRSGWVSIRPRALTSSIFGIVWTLTFIREVPTN